MLFTITNVKSRKLFPSERDKEREQKKKKLTTKPCDNIIHDKIFLR